MNNQKTVIGVTAFKNVESPQSGFGVARCLKEEGYTVIGLDDIPLTSAIFAPYLDSIYLIKSMGEEKIADFIVDLKKIIDKTGMKILIPCYDREVYFFNKYLSEIEELGIKLLLPSTQSLRMAAKPFLSNLNKIGVNVPKTLRVYDEKDIEKTCEEFGFPVVCKGIIKEAYVANNSAEAKSFFQKIREIWHGGTGFVLFQEFIFGETITISGVANKENNVVGKVIMKKLGIDSNGTTWSGMTYHSKELNELCNRIIRHLKWIGPFELEFIKDIKTGKFFLFEINPRLPSWIYLSKIAGCNIPTLIIDLIMGNKLMVNSDFKDEIIFSRYSEEIFYTKDEFDNFKKSGKKLIPIFGIGGKKNNVRKMNKEMMMISSGKGATGKVPSYVRKILKEEGLELENTVEISAAEELLFGDENDK